MLKLIDNNEREVMVSLLLLYSVYVTLSKRDGRAEIVT